MKKLNKEELKHFAELNDAALWESIKNIAKENGYILGDKVASHDDLEKVRAILRGTERLNMSEAARLINTYKKK